MENGKFKETLETLAIFKTTRYNFDLSLIALESIFKIFIKQMRCEDMKLTKSLLKKISNKYEKNYINIEDCIHQKDREKFFNALQFNKHIKKIKFTYNEMDEKDTKLLVHCLQLRQIEVEVNLAHNYIKDEGMEEIALCNSFIRSLNISDNQITEFGVEKLATTQLRKLNISNNLIRDEGLASISNNKNDKLVELNISGCQIREIPAQLLTDMPALTSLNMSNNHLANNALQVFNGTQQLEKLDLSSNYIADDGIAHLHHTSIKELNLSSCLLLTEEGIETLIKNNSLIEVINLYGTNINALNPEVLINHSTLKTVGLDSGNLNVEDMRQKHGELQSTSKQISPVTPTLMKQEQKNREQSIKPLNHSHNNYFFKYPDSHHLDRDSKCNDGILLMGK